MTTRNKMYTDWIERYLAQIDVDFSVEPLTVEETNEEWQRVFGQETAPEEYNWVGVYLDSLDDLYGTGNIDYTYTVEEFNELLIKTVKTMYNIVNLNEPNKHSQPMTA